VNEFRPTTRKQVVKKDTCQRRQGEHLYSSTSSWNYVREFKSIAVHFSELIKEKESIWLQSHLK